MFSISLVTLYQVKQGLGGNVRLILSGAAPLSNHVEAFLRVVTCAHVLQGYGMNELPPLCMFYMFSRSFSC